MANQNPAPGSPPQQAQLTPARTLVVAVANTVIYVGMSLIKSAYDWRKWAEAWGEEGKHLPSRFPWR
jgi:hypothetical protein